MVVSLNSIELVKEFGKIVLDSGKYVIAESGDYRVDAGSIMGLFSLDLTKPITLKFPDDADELKESYRDLLFIKKKNKIIIVQITSFAKIAI